MQVKIHQEILQALEDTEALGSTVPEVGAASAGFRLGFRAAMSAIRERFDSQRLGQRIQTVQARVEAVADSDDSIIRALKSKLASLKQSRYMVKATGPSKYRQAGTERMNATPTEDAMISLLEDILKGEVD